MISCNFQEKDKRGGGGVYSISFVCHNFIIEYHFIDAYYSNINRVGMLNIFQRLFLNLFYLQGMSEVVVLVKNHGRKNDSEEYVNFFFTPSADSKNGTGVQGGQIPQILFYA